MKYILFLFLGMASWVACTPWLLCTNQPPTTEQKPQAPNAQSETQGTNMSAYLDRVVPLIKASIINRTPHVYQKRKKRSKLSIKFHILEDGQITNVVYIATSGDTTLDQAVYDGMTNASPLPPLPSEFGCKYIEIRANLYWGPFSEFPKGGEKTHARVTCVSSKIISAAVEVSPASAEVLRGATQQFLAVISDESKSEVNWKVSGTGCSGSTCGSISPEGLYTAPSVIPTPPLVTVTATLVTDPTEAATATVTVVRLPTPP
jgi:TonB family protein